MCFEPCTLWLSGGSVSTAPKSNTATMASGFKFIVILGSKIFFLVASSPGDCPSPEVCGAYPGPAAVYGFARSLTTQGKWFGANNDDGKSEFSGNAKWVCFQLFQYVHSQLT